jgi:uncharacterized membrane protein
MLESLRNAFYDGKCISKLIDCCRNITKNLKSEVEILINAFAQLLSQDLKN